MIFADTISVKSDGNDVSNSPAVINVIDAPSAKNTIVDGDGVEKGKVDKPNKFKIHAKDANLFNATVSDPYGNKTPITLKPDGMTFVGTSG